MWLWQCTGNKSQRETKSQNNTNSENKRNYVERRRCVCVAEVPVGIGRRTAAFVYAPTQAKSSFGFSVFLAIEWLRAQKKDHSYTPKTACNGTRFAH